MCNVIYDGSLKLVMKTENINGKKWQKNLSKDFFSLDNLAVSRSSNEHHALNRFHYFGNSHTLLLSLHNQQVYVRTNHHPIRFHEQILEWEVSFVKSVSASRNIPYSVLWWRIFADVNINAEGVTILSTY